VSKFKKKILIYLTVYLIFTDNEQDFSESEKKSLFLYITEKINFKVVILLPFSLLKML